MKRPVKLLKIQDTISEIQSHDNRHRESTANDDWSVCETGLNCRRWVQHYHWSNSGVGGQKRRRVPSQVTILRLATMNSVQVSHSKSGLQFLETMSLSQSLVRLSALFGIRSCSAALSSSLWKQKHGGD